MTPGTEIRLSLEPVVTRPRVMTPGRPHLVAVDLRLMRPHRGMAVRRGGVRLHLHARRGGRPFDGGRE